MTRDRPALWWFLSLLFLTVSCAFLYIGIVKQADVAAWQAGLTTLFGLIGVVASGWIASHAPLSSVSLDSAGTHLEITRLGITGRRNLRYPVASIVRLIIQKRNDDEGYPMTRPAIRLDDGETIPLSLLWRHGEKDTAMAIDAVRDAIPRLRGKPMEVLEGTA